MNADATPEKRPACALNQHWDCWGVKAKAHKDEGRIKVVIILFHKSFVVLLGLLIVCPVKFRAVFRILHDCQRCPNRGWETYEGRRRVVTFTALFVVFLYYFVVRRMEGRRRDVFGTALPSGGLFAKNRESVGA